VDGKNAKFNAKLVARFPFLWGVAKEQHSSQSKAFPLPVRSLFSGHVPASAYPLQTPRQQFAHDGTLHLLTRLQQYPLREAERADLIQSIEGYAIPHDQEPGAGLSGCASHTGPVGFVERLHFRYAYGVSPSNDLRSEHRALLLRTAEHYRMHADKIDEPGAKWEAFMKSFGLTP